MTETQKLKQVAAVFFKLGLFAFGGPAAHIAMMEHEVVTKRAWMTREHYLDLIGATNLIPGPNSTEMTMHCGYQRAGKKGLFIAGISFVFPAVFITAILGYLYVLYGALPQVQPFIKGIQPAVIVIIASAVIKLGKKAVKNWELALLGSLFLAASLLGLDQVLVLFAGGLLGMCYFLIKSKMQTTSLAIAPLFMVFIVSEIGAKLSAMGIFLKFLKVGSILYGSGYVLFAYLDTELVTTALLSQNQLLEAIGIGQFTPGPVLSTATFIGYQLGGFWGAIAATAGIFMPSFLFVWLLNPLIPKMRKSKVLGYFLDSINVAAVAIMLAVVITMSKQTLVDWQAALIAILSGILIFGFKKVSVMWVLIIGAILGYVLAFI
ncbi:MAG: chromate efflux transporter [Bacteroidetes bacterium]|jgi:chromate transporter|nr:chromate efflux transporter [Bacteroidota bacterium]MBT7305275.1 chromate efflux transporter [Bacteroidota bacterium]